MGLLWHTTEIDPGLAGVTGAIYRIDMFSFCGELRRESECGVSTDEQ